MNITCPSCAIQFPLVAGMNDADARRVAGLMGEVPPGLAALLLQYLNMFKPPKSGLTWKRTHSLLAKLSPDIEHQRIKYNGREWGVTPEHWAIGLQDIIDRKHKLSLPLKNHNYLYSILSGEADKAEAKAEAGRERARQQRRQHSAPSTTTKSVTPVLLHHKKSELKAVQLLLANSNNESLQKQAVALQEEIARLEQQL